MTTSLIKRSDLLGRLVIDQQSTEELGHIDQLFIDIQTHQIAIVKCTSGFLGRMAHTFDWADINNIGTDSVLINWNEENLIEPSAAVNPMIGLEIWADSGNKVGIIKDYCLDSETGKVIDYLFVSGGWRGIQEGLYRLPSSGVVSVGRKRVIAKDEVLQSAEQFSSGLQEKFSQAAEFLKEDYAKTQADMASLLEGAQTSASKLQDSAQHVTAQVKETATDVQEHLQTAVHKAAEKVQETAASVQQKVDAAPSEDAPASDQKSSET